jgi:selenocysteine lyase/cysteine desulfurase
MSPRLTRRAALGAAALPLAGALAACGSREARPSSSGSEDERVHSAEVASWAGVRSLFDLSPDQHHLTAFILSPHSRPVRAAIARHRAGMDAEPHRYEQANAHLENEAAQAAADYLATDVDQVALTDSTTMGLGTFFGGMRLESGDEVLMTAHDHFTARGAVDLAVARAGARRVEIELYPPTAPEQASVDAIATAYDRAITDATRAVLVTWVHSATGLRMPVRDIADVVRRHNRDRPEKDRALLVVDGVHGLGTTASPRIEDLGADVLIAGCHKWLAGPRGTGLVWARRAAWRRTGPFITSWSSWGGEDAPGAAMTPGGYHSFEHRWALGPAFALQQLIGPERIAGRIEQLNRRLRDGLAELRGVTVHAPRDPALHSGLTTFTVANRSAADTIEHLYTGRRVVGSVTPYAVQLARLGTSWMNTEAEVDAAVAAVAAVR